VGKVGAQLTGAKQFTDFREFVDSAPQLAIVASPPKFHAQQTISLLEGGASVLCEKPIASNSAEAGQMLAAATRAKRKLAVGLFRRFFPACKLIREYIATEILGKVVDFEFSEGGMFNWPAQSASFFQKETAQGGVFFDVGAHLLDLMLWWFGDPTSFEYSDDAMGGLEINSVARFEFANGLHGRVQLSRDWELPNKYVIRCEKGWFAWKVGDANHVEIGANGTGYTLLGETLEDRSSAANYAESFVAQLANCIKAITDGQPLVVPGEEGIRSLRLIEKCYRSRKLLPMPWLTEVEMARARELAV
ncbi:MAG: Gfo/Idh/MocA family oxidoreductase, partial [Verrucomicrobia bacterium]|nr:Gfo/Idh/MocA family oxidoreductase [Verrucomicrobiota bacterium]